MTRRGIAKGKLIELEDALPFPDGQTLDLVIEPLSIGAPSSATSVLRAMREPPHPDQSDIDELEQRIADGRLPMRAAGAFDEE